MEKCKTCANGYPSVSCTNCGIRFRNYVEIGHTIEDYIRKATKQTEELQAYKDTGLTPEQIKALAADKDEQAERIMQMEDGLKRLRISFQWLYETIGSFFAYKEWAKEKIDAIDALLGGAEG